MAIDQATVDAGTDPYTPQIAARKKRAEGFASQAESLGKQGVDESKALAGMIEKRGEAEKPLYTSLAERLKTRPSARVDEENIPSFQRPKGDNKEMERGMSALAVAAMLVSVASRAPFYGMAQAMQGYMKGYMDADQKVVNEAMATYDKNLEAVKQRNASKRRAVEAALKDYENDLLGMQQQLKIVAAQYDDPILAKKVMVGSISDQQKIALEQLKVEGNAIDHLIQARESMLLRKAILDDRISARQPKGARGVAPTGKDTQTAQQILSSFPWYSTIKDNETTLAISAEVAARAKSLVVRGDVADFADGVDQAVDDLQKEGLLKIGKKRTFWFDDPTKFQRPDPSATPPAAGGVRGDADTTDLEQKAHAAIASGKDPAAVAKRFKEMTGKDLPNGPV